MTDPVFQATTQPTPAQVEGEMLKPVEGWKSATTKLAAAVGALSAVAGTGLGVANIVRGRTAYGVGNLAGAAIAGTFAKAEWDTAKAADRSRNFVELKKQLDAQNVAMGRA